MTRPWELNAPRVSIVIPTVDRSTYLRHTLDTCVRQDYGNLEVLVCDDASEEPVAEVVDEAARRDRRIRHLPNGSRLGMRDNFEQALRRVTGEYVLVLGGDDGILPGGISKMVTFLREMRAEVATWAAPIYTYPGVRGPTSQLAMFRSGKSRMVSSKSYLARVTHSLNYLRDLETPMCYVKGVVSRRLIEETRAKSPDGRFYSCPTPDGYSGIALAAQVDAFAVSGEPFTIFGVSPSSQGIAYLSEKEEGVRRSEAFFRQVESRPMHANLASQPYSPLITLMTADYLLTVKGWADRPDLFKAIDMHRLLHLSLSELSHGLFGRARVARELAILERIAEHHGIRAWFDRQLSGWRRRRSRAPFVGTGINASGVLWDAKKLRITNVAEAAQACVTINCLRHEVAPMNVLRVLYRSVSYKLAALLPGGYLRA